MAGQISSLAATTELEALNSVMSAMGQAPFPDIASAIAGTDGQMALALLRNVTRDVQAMGWQFNTEFGLALAPVTTSFDWTDPDTTHQTLAVFKVPSGLARWDLSATSDQSSLDVAARPSKQYQEAALPVLVFYDRTKNRDGFPATERTKLYIDATWYFDFEFLPETVRAYIVAFACKMALKDLLKDPEGAEALNDRLGATYRSLKREQGDTDIYNIFSHPDVQLKFGFRPRLTGQVIDPRNTP